MKFEKTELAVCAERDGLLMYRKKHGIDSAGYFYFVIIIDNLSVIHRIVSGLTWLGTAH